MSSPVLESDGQTGASAPPACAWCQAPLDGAQRLTGRLRCARCGAETTDPWPTDAELEAAYGDWYRPPTGRFAGAGDTVLRRFRGGLADRVDRIAPSGPVLDVGAGDGVLVDALRDRGRPTTGLERKPVRHDLHAGELQALPGPYAAIVFWHSLEHLRAPGEALRHAADRLMPGGVLVLSMPNVGSWQAHVFGDRWFALDLPRHLVHVPAQAVTSRLETLGLRVERTSHVRGGQVVFGWLHGLTRELPGQPDLYAAIRRPEARNRPVSPGRCAATLGAAAALFPVAAAAAGAEVAARRGGTIYVEARK
ncbi:MAG TPA: class I SAM-dependent methyltransferase [Solirubrobacteraceae bacterium]|nr:class I SAM-dependent methyltransferase [Solirubrobacteraceae bacterium]